MCCIYILELELGRYYIGRTDNLENRIWQHFHNEGCYFTKMFHPVKILTVIHDASVFDEDRYVIEYMSKYGIQNVRGGSYSKLNLTNEQYIAINCMIRNALDKCLRCGGDHFIAVCSKTVMSIHEKNLIENQVDCSTQTDLTLLDTIFYRFCIDDDFVEDYWLNE